MKVEVLVIGGGIAGLYTAMKCVQMGKSVMLIEKTGRLGGRIRTIYQPFQYEAGAGRFHQQHILLRGLIQQFGLHEIPLGRKKQYEGQTSPENRLLQKLLTRMNTMAPEFLHYARFVDVCRYVLGPDDATLLQHAFGYDGEFEQLNAYDGLQMFQRDFQSSTYYICAEGMSAIVEKLQDLLGDQRIHKNTRVTNIYKQHDQGFRVCAINEHGKTIFYESKVVVCALPKQDMEGMKLFNKHQRDLLDTVVPIPLHRIYGQFPYDTDSKKVWFHGIPKTTTHHPIRQFIPMKERDGFAMVSYSDSSMAEYWKENVDQGMDHLQKEILQQLQIVFPNISHIPSPTWIQSYFWPHGVHFWKEGARSDVLAPKIQQILGKETPFFIVGEAYAKHQGWIEGALESVEAILPFLKAIRNRPITGAGTGNGNLATWLQRRKGVISASSLEHIREKFPNEKWILMRHPKTQKTVFVDVGEWMHRHPGGPDVLQNRLYTNISDDFYQVPNHLSSDEKHTVRDHVLEELDRYVRAVVI